MKKLQLIITSAIAMCSISMQAQNVGIGTTTPDGKLTIADTLENTLTLKTLDNFKDVGIAFQNSGNNYVWNIYRSDAGASQAHLIFAGGINKSNISDLTERMRITSLGKVGIGTNNPSEKLEIIGGIKIGNSFGTNTGTLRWTGTDFEGYSGDKWLSLTKSELLTSGTIERSPFTPVNSLVLDAHQTQYNQSAGSADFVAQSFTVENNGKLTEVEISPWQAFDSIKIRIYDGEGVNGVLLTEETFSGVDSGWVSFPLPDSIPLIRGNQYTLWVENPVGAAILRTRNGNKYSGGSVILINGPRLNLDLAFKTYVLTTDTVLTVISIDSTLKQFTFGGDAIVVDSLLHVGIGTNSPESQLDVDGDINLSGTLMQDGSAFLPVGAIIMYYGNVATAPQNWLICNGSNFDAATYSELNVLLGGNTLPNFSGRFAMGVGNSGTAGSTTHHFGNNGGEEKHTLSQSEMPAHTHKVTITYREGSEGGNSNNYSDLGGGSTSSRTYTSQSKGGGAAHNNLPPYLTVHYIIKAK